MKKMLIKGLLYSLLTFFLVGCVSTGTDEDPKKTVQLTLKFETDASVNLNSKGQANPILISVYELKTPSTFEQLDYFSLQEKDRVLLGEDFILKDEFIMRPEEQKILVKKLAKDTEAIGFVAAYQDLSKASWRKVYRLGRKEQTKMLPKWSQWKQKEKLAIDLRAHDMIIFDKEMDRF